MCAARLPLDDHGLQGLGKGGKGLSFLLYGAPSTLDPARIQVKMRISGPCVHRSFREGQPGSSASRT